MSNNNFSIEEEIDAVVDKMAEQLKVRLKKLVNRSEKIVLKQYIASQKETTRVTASKAKTTGVRNSRGQSSTEYKKATSRQAPKKEADYGSSSEESYSDSDRD
jgi:hypothetical protein